jgi:ribosomal protein L37AE/L43A
MPASAQYDLRALLEASGARIRGRNRADCPKCKRQRAVSFDESRGVYHCHEAGCNFSGGAGKLARELGLAQHLTAAGYRELRQEREQADRAARALYERMKARRFELLEELYTLNQLELGVHETGPENPATWDVLAQVYAERPGILAELAFLENSPAGKVLQFLNAKPAQWQAVSEAILLQGDMCDYAGKFVEACP